MNLMDRGARWATVHGSLKELDMNEQVTHTHTHILFHIGYYKILTIVTCGI